MAGLKKAATTEAAKVDYNVEVKKAKVIKDGVAVFDLVVNGVTIYGCWYREYTNSKGEEGTMISFPSQKGKDGEYYNHAWFPISKELKDKIVDQVLALV